jgi:hypothetical protein
VNGLSIGETDDGNDGAVGMDADGAVGIDADGAVDEIGAEVCVNTSAKPRFAPRFALDGFKPSKHPIFVEVDPYTMAVRTPSITTEEGGAGAGAGAGAGDRQFDGLYAAGPMRGDNFVRFLVGDAFAIRKHISEKRKEEKCKEASDHAYP